MEAAASRSARSCCIQAVCVALLLRLISLSFTPHSSSDFSHTHDNKRAIPCAFSLHTEALSACGICTPFVNMKSAPFSRKFLMPSHVVVALLLVSSTSGSVVPATTNPGILQRPIDRFCRATNAAFRQTVFPSLREYVDIKDVEESSPTTYKTKALPEAPGIARPVSMVIFCSVPTLLDGMGTISTPLRRSFSMMKFDNGLCQWLWRLRHTVPLCLLRFDRWARNARGATGG